MLMNPIKGIDLEIVTERINGKLLSLIILILLLGDRSTDLPTGKTQTLQVSRDILLFNRVFGEKFTILGWKG
jgi:hypothetical protein